MRNVIAMGGIVASLLFATAAPAAAQEAAPDGVTISVATANGSGCPAGTGTATSTGGNSFTVISPAYFAWGGGQASPTDFRKNCQLSVQVDRPEGWTYAVVRIDSSGFAYLGSGVRGLSRINLYFQGMSQTTSFSHAFTGPLAEAWQTTDTVREPALVYAPCDAERNLNINTELRVLGGTPGPSVGNILLRDAATTVRLTWQRCAV